MNNKFILIVLQTLSFFFFLGCDQIKSRISDNFKNELKTNNLSNNDDINEVDKNQDDNTIISKPINNTGNTKKDNKRKQIKENSFDSILLDSGKNENIKSFNIIGIDKNGPYQSGKNKKIKSNPK